MISFSTVVERALDGPICSERDFELEIFVPAVRRVVKELMGRLARAAGGQECMPEICRKALDSTDRAGIRGARTICCPQNFRQPWDFLPGMPHASGV